MATTAHPHRIPSCRVKLQSAAHFAALRAELECVAPLPPERAAAIARELARAPYAPARQGELELPA